MNDAEIKNFVKQYVNSKIEKLNEKINEELEEKVTGPTAKAVARFKESKDSVNFLMKDVESLKEKIRGLEAGSPDPFPRFTEGALNMIPLHMVRTMKFFEITSSMVKNNKDLEDIADDLGERFGNDSKLYIDCMISSLNDTKQNKLKNACAGIKKLLEANL